MLKAAAPTQTQTMASVSTYARAERARVRAIHVVCLRLAEECAAAAAEAVAGAVGKSRCVIRGMDAVQRMGPAGH